MISIFELEARGSTLVPEALSLDAVRLIVFDHADFIAALIDSAPSFEMSQHEMAMVGAKVLMMKPSIYNLIIARGCHCDEGAAANTPPLQKAALALHVLRLTAKEHGQNELRSAVFDVLTNMSGYLGQVRH